MITHIIHMFLLTLLMIIHCEENVYYTPQLILQEMHNTRKLISLYQQKLQLLVKIQQDMNITNEQLEQIYEQQYFIKNSATLQENIQEKYPILYKPIYHNKTYLFQHKYLVSGNRIYNLQGQQYLDFLGTILQVGKNSFTTLLSNHQLSIMQLNNDVKSENFISLSQQFPIDIEPSIVKWHFSHDIQNILITVHQNLIYFLCSNQKVYNSGAVINQPYIKQDQKNRYFIQIDHNVLNIYSINQYKIIYFTRSAYGIINVRSLNIIQQKKLPQEILDCNRFENSILILTKTSKIYRIIGNKLIEKDLLVKNNNQTLNEWKISKITYMPPYLFGYDSRKDSIVVFNMSEGSFVFWKKITLGKKCENCLFSYQFYKNKETFHLLLNMKTSTQSTQQHTAFQYDLQIPTQLPSQQSYFLWKIIIIVIILIGILYWRSRKQKINPQQKLKKVKTPEQILQYINNQVGKKQKSKKIE